MPDHITPEEAVEYKARWAALHAREREEWRTASPEAKLRQLDVLYASIDVFGWRESLEREDWLSHQRWNELRERYREWTEHRRTPSSTCPTDPAAASQ